MKKKGFTLIELLAVIVILAIIALIATPLVLKYIEKSRKESKVDSAYSFVRNLETEIANYSIKNNGKKYNGQPTDKGYYELTSFENSEIDTTVKGDKPNSIKVCLSSLGQVDKAMFEYGKYYVSYDGKKGSISDKDTYDNFSCSGNVGSNVGESIVSKSGIEFVEEDGEIQALLDNCFDPGLFEYGNYYNLVLTDENGNIYNNRLIAQNSVNGLTSTTEPSTLYLSHPKENLIYIHNQKLNLCALIFYSYEDGSYLLNKKFDIRIDSYNEKVEPNYVFRMTQDGDYMGDFSFFSSDLKSGDEVRFEFGNGKTYMVTVCGDCTEDRKKIYDKQYYKFVEMEIPESDNFYHYVYDVNVIVNNGEKVYNFKKEDFIETITDIGDKQYHIGNNDIHFLDVA